MWKGIENTTTLLFPLKGLEILCHERRGQVKTIVMERFEDNILITSYGNFRFHVVSI